MDFLGLLIFMIITFAQPQYYVPALKRLSVVYLVLSFTGIFWIIQKVFPAKINIGKAQQNVLMLIFWFIIILSTLSVSWLYYSYNTFIEWGKILVIYFLIVSIIDSEKKLSNIFWVIVLSMTITAGVGILQYYGMDRTGAGLSPEGRIRGVGIFDTNQLAYGLCFCFPLIFGLFLLSKSFIAKLALLAISSVYFYCLILTQSRGGLLCFVLTLLFINYKFGKSRLLKFGGLIFGGLLFIVFLKFAPRFSSTLHYQSDGSAMGRIDAWASSLIQLKTSFLLGIGKDQFREYFRISAHSSYIQVLTELGLFGFFVWISLFYFSMNNLGFVIRAEGEKVSQPLVNFSKIIQVCLAAYLIGSFFSSSAYYIPLFMFFAISVGIQKISRVSMRTRFTSQDFLAILMIEMAIILGIHTIAKL